MTSEFVLGLLEGRMKRCDGNVREAASWLVEGGIPAEVVAEAVAAHDEAVERRGPKLVVVLTGPEEAVRADLQRRLEEELVDRDPSRWHTLTSVEADFEPRGNPAAYLADVNDQRVLCVMKSEPARSGSLLAWLRSRP